MNYLEYGALIADHLDFAYYICDVETYELLYFSKAGYEFCGFQDHSGYQGQKCYKIIQGRDEPCPFCPNRKLSEGQAYRWEHHNEKNDMWFDISDSLMRIENRLCCLAVVRNITARKKNTRQFEQMTAEDILVYCLHTMPKEPDLNASVNLFLEALCGYHQADRAYIFELDWKRQTLSNTFEWCRPGVSSEKDRLQNLPLETVDRWMKKFMDVGEFSISSLEHEVSPDSEEYHLLELQGVQSLLAAPLLQDGEIAGFVGVDNPTRERDNLMLLRSVSECVLEDLEKRRLMAELEYLSYIDTLTGLKNRNRYARALKDFDSRPPGTLGIITLDINGLKSINETHGQNYGDNVIKKTGELLQCVLPDAVFRTSGNEFTALCADMSREAFQDAVVTLRAGFDANRDFHVSIGCAWGAGEIDINGLIQQADELRRAEKQSYYHTVLREGRTVSRSGFADEVLREIENQKFAVFYQPQVDIKTNRVIGAEALVRKRDEDGNLIPPGKFIPFYEAGGVIGHIDLYVMRAACAALRRWLDKGYCLHLSVNFSRITLLEPDIVETIRAICTEHQVPPSVITIEVTESISKMEHGRLTELVASLTSAGFTISLDDFGSQYSNLAILAEMDFDEVKFDKTLVSALEDSPKSRVVMENSVRLCRCLEKTTSLAEGIETEGQLGLLRDYGCDYGQGYYFSRPVPPEEFDGFLQKNLTNRKDGGLSPGRDAV